MAIATGLTDIYGDPVDRYMTADQLLAIGERLPNAQLIDGEVVVNAPRYGHQHTVLELTVRLREWVKGGHGRGTCGSQIDVRLNDRNLYVPDVWWVGERRRLGNDDYFRGPPDIPDIAVEVLSPSTRRTDRGVKRSQYEKVGLPELWIIDPTAMTATIWRRTGPEVSMFDVTVKLGCDDPLESPQLPGFATRLGDLFPTGR
jgi:Uma2 family endonuclease